MEEMSRSVKLNVQTVSMPQLCVCELLQLSTSKLWLDMVYR